MVPQADALARDVRFNDDGPLKQLLLLIVILNHGTVQVMVYIVLTGSCVDAARRGYICKSSKGSQGLRDRLGEGNHNRDDLYGVNIMHPLT